AVGENLMRHGAFARVPEDEVLAYVENVRGEHEDRLDDLLEELLSPSEADALHYLEPTKHLVKGWAREEIPRLAHEIEADLVVMGTVARSGIPGLFMGNTAETILNRIDCSVMAIKPPGFRTPVTLDG
ncbi:MAG: universal stress protein, partial [Gammaproteobacteria bacterium]|nr:universal stress protein [Gammaproteobacteria bacterium]